jgi:hypothetical protein
MSSNKKKEKRRSRAKERAKKLKERKAKGKKNMGGLFPMSMCPTCGPYTMDNLCDCYDENGLLNGRTYEQQFRDSYANLDVPVTGERYNSDGTVSEELPMTPEQREEALDRIFGK